MRQEYKEKRDIMINALTSIGIEKPGGEDTFYLWQKTPENIDSIKFANLLVDHGIIVTPGQMISEEIDGINHVENFVRFALVPNVDEVKEAAIIIKKINIADY